MALNLKSQFQKIEPLFWQETSRISSILLFTGWISLYYRHLTEAPVSYGRVWLVSSLVVLASAFFGAHYRQTRENQQKISKILLPGFLLGLILSLQVLRYPQDWPFFSAMFTNFITSLTLHNRLTLDFWHFLYLLYLTWRGLVIGRTPADSQAQQRAFLGFILGFLFYQMLLAPQDQTSLLPSFCGLFLLGLIGLPAGRIMTVSMFRGGRLPKVRQSWVLSIIAVASVALIAGLGFSLILNLSLAKVAAALFLSTFSGVIYLLFLALSPIAYMIMLALSKFLENLLAGTEMALPDTLAGQEMVNPNAQEVQEAARHTFLSMQNILLIGVALLLVYIIWRTLKRKPWESKKSLNLEEGEISKEALPKFRLPFDLQSLRERLNLRPGKGLSAIQIRWIYATLCYYGKLLGSPRKPAVTPLEYQSALNLLFPENIAEVQGITSAYIAVRYGNIPENPLEFKKIQASWTILEMKAKESLGSLKKQQKQTRK